MGYALTGPDAVFFWTKGGYQTDRFFGFYPIHLKVDKRHVSKWERFFSSEKMRVYIEGQPSRRTLFGVFYVLYPQVDFEVEEVDGFCVSPLKETVEYCQKNIYSYEPGLEMLDEMYSLGLNTTYMEIKTNVQGVNMEFVNRENEILRTLDSLADRTSGFFSDKVKENKRQN